MSEPLLVIGLGNPGPQYAKTRHNIGFMVAELLADRLGATFKVHKRSGAEIVTSTLGQRPVVLAKPRTYMNESGRHVGPLAKFYSVAPADVPENLSREAVEIARGVLDQLEVVGVLCVEFFLTKGGKLLGIATGGGRQESRGAKTKRFHVQRRCSSLLPDLNGGVSRVARNALHSCLGTFGRNASQRSRALAA